MPERSFGRTVRYRRTKLGLSQAKLGELVGRSAATVRSWERDATHPTETKVVAALAAILGVDQRALFTKAGLEVPPSVETSPTVEEALASLAPELAEVKVVEADPAGIEDEAEDEVEPIPPSDEVEETPPPDVVEETPPWDDVEPAPAEPTPPSDQASQEEEEVFSPPSPPPNPPLIITTPTPPLLEPSYIEDQTQRQLYRVRNLATLVAVVALIIALLWALSQSIESFGDWWDGFFGDLRL